MYLYTQNIFKGELYMETIQKEKLGIALRILLILQLVFSGFALIAYMTMFFMSDKIKVQLNIDKAADMANFSTIDIVFILMVVVGIILILMKKKLGIYIYLIGQSAHIIHMLVTEKFEISMVLDLLIPVLTAYLIWKNISMFNVERKS